MAMNASLGEPSRPSQAARHVCHRMLQTYTPLARVGPPPSRASRPAVPVLISTSPSIITRRMNTPRMSTCVCAGAEGDTTSTAPGVSLAAAADPAGRPASATAARKAATRDDFAIDQRPVILFDGVCNLCNGGVNFMMDNDPSAVFRLAALQSPAGRRLLLRCGRQVDDLSSIVLVEKNRHFIRSEAILRIGAALRLPLPALAALGFPLPLPLRDTLYDAVANNRYSFFGRTGACRLRDAGRFADRFIVD
ncbi:hypothetical protein VOLCADRAFT_90057 [Volvox carteri f. nagariensis]|uniref:Thiol-disulfide oxidoreductase DCC n=1 Tax=Volvox carteri f. nagariensis TaxID=3068 RepID=D8TTD4_VOLCA|nr:uncharacterized protein VOLCADRAFT_90057 [Volvox carteri f. nagariensis]EFJ49181.1 hypothetical protein VOLCADRAFT_90057 [Volvox carteri f. nagariensis]|eukprot:XP_002949629.1 hypothetical protein VOLCADRAFT_90057 [Volvox carteri f. nagariensis]